MAKARDDSGFERDFGYLLPFLDKVETTARGLSDPAARERLLALMAEEKRRWQEIRALLSGQPAPTPVGPVSVSRGQIAAPAPPRPEISLTVGSLRPSR